MSDTIYKLQKGLKSTALRRRYIRKEQIELISRFLVCRMQYDFGRLRKTWVHYILFHKQTVREMIIILIQAAVIRDIR